MWYDYLVRRPNDVDIRRRSKEQLPAPTEVFTSTYPKARRDGADIKLALRGYEGDSDQSMISTGLTPWKASSDVLCNYLLNDDDIKKDRKNENPSNPYDNEYRVLELGSGLGKCGLLVHLLLQSNGYTNTTVLTDGDTNVLRLLQKNISFNTFSNDNDDISRQQLKWGKDEAEAFLSQQDHDLSYDDYKNQTFDLIIGSDLLYTERNNIYPLIDTVAVLLSSLSGGKFILAHNEEHSIPVEWLRDIASRHNMFCEILKQKGQIYLLCFRRMTFPKVNSMAERLHDKITELESKVRTLEVNQSYAEDKILRLDKRCSTLRNDNDLPKSILLSFDEDNLASILSFLEPQDFAQMASTCKRFGLRKHRIGMGYHHVSVSLMKKIAYKIYEGASSKEKEVLPLYQSGYSPFFLYNELNKLRMPLKFDQLFGRYIQHVFGDRSIIKPSPMDVGIKTAPWARRTIRAFTAVSDHVMRVGKHYVTFTCSGLGSEDDHPLWFGVVMPLKQFNPNSPPLFTPFNEDWVDDLRELLSTEWGDSDIHSCVYKARDGQCKSTDWVFDNRGDNDEDTDEHEYTLNVTNEDWEGMQTFEGCGEIGLLLDYDEGTLTVYKNDIKLGVIKSGLSGAYCWMVSVGSRWGGEFFTSDSKARIKIERSPLPEDYKVPQEKRPRIE